MITKEMINNGMISYDDLIDNSEEEVVFMGLDDLIDNINE